MTPNLVETTGRLRAVSFCKGLVIFTLLAFFSGCKFSATGSGGESILSSLIPASDASVSRRAAEIPYATLRFTHNGRGGLIVLAEVADTLTFWPTAERQAIVFNAGYLDRTAGLEMNLLATNIINSSLESLFDASTSDYALERTWEQEDGSVITGQATARMVCADGLQTIKLPLTTLDLRYCMETIAWTTGQSTSSEFWVAKKSGRIWWAKSEPWPGSGSFEWQVARPWW